MSSSIEEVAVTAEEEEEEEEEEEGRREKEEEVGEVIDEEEEEEEEQEQEKGKDVVDDIDVEAYQFLVVFQRLTSTYLELFVKHYIPLGRSLDFSGAMDE